MMTGHLELPAIARICYFIQHFSYMIHCSDSGPGPSASQDHLSFSGLMSALGFETFTDCLEIRFVFSLQKQVSSSMSE